MNKLERYIDRAREEVKKEYRKLEEAGLLDTMCATVKATEKNPKNFGTSYMNQCNSMTATVPQSNEQPRQYNGDEPDRIICLVGESGNGKTTIAKMLEARGYNVIKSYTTREPRSDDEWGHRFVDPNSIDLNIVPADNFIAYTFYDGHHYWATREQYRGKGTSIYIIDPAGVESLRRNVDDAEVIVIYLNADYEARTRRMMEDRTPEEMVQRLDHDCEAFRVVGCDYVVDANGDKQEVLNNVIEVISSVEGDGGTVC